VALSDKYVEDLVVGTYFAELNLTYQQIAELMGTSTADIGRALGRLRDKGVLRTVFTYDEEEYTDGDGDAREATSETQSIRERVLIEMREPRLEAKLKNLFDAHLLKDVLVAKSMPESIAEKVENANIRHTAWIAATRIIRFLNQVGANAHERDDGLTRIGVAWGYSVQQAIEAVKKQQRSIRLRKPCLVFNTAGDMMDSTSSEDRTDYRNPKGLRDKVALQRSTMSRLSTTLSGNLADLLKSELVQFSAPGWMPPRDSLEAQEESREQFKAWFNSYAGYRSIFAKFGHFTNADLVITGIGNKEILHALLERTERLDIPEMQKWNACVENVINRAVGDFAGSVLTENGLDDTEEGRWVRLTHVGASVDEYLRAAEKARSNPRALGVLALVEGCSKAAAVRAAVRAKLINVLVVDEALASTICD